jgi:hypothetical protein
MDSPKTSTAGCSPEESLVFRRGWRHCRLSFLSMVLLLVLSAALSSKPAHGQLSTEDHLAEPGFWPTRDFPTRQGFVGPDTCAGCHGEKLATQRETPMARTAMPAHTAEILHSHPVMGFEIGKYHYQVQTDAQQSIYSITDGTRKLAYPLTWAFGTGRVAQSYLFKMPDGNFYESRVSYFTHVGKLGFTPARALDSPSSVEEAMYRPVPAAEVLRCFACHGTTVSIAGSFDERHFIPGVTCEACHGPGETHVTAMESETPGNPSRTIFNSGRLTPADSVDFCGACHGSWWDVKLAGVKGPSTTRSAPYRLVTSKCWGTKGDARLTCTACHDPHKQLETAAHAYDQKCLACHVNATAVNTALPSPTASHPGAACPKAVSNCTTCHMPKVNVAEMQSDFTDHRIRIAKPGESFPE